MAGAWNAVPGMQITGRSFASIELEVNGRADWVCLVTKAKSLRCTI